jgi:hypothetical protein
MWGDRIHGARSFAVERRLSECPHSWHGRAQFAVFSFWFLLDYY